MKYLVVGCNGLLGSNLCRHLFARQHEVVGIWHNSRPAQVPWRIRQGNVLDAEGTRTLIQEERPDVVVNCVGLVSIDQCEADPAYAHRVNALTAEHLAKACAATNARLLAISTDHLFAGTRSLYTEDDPPQPINAYAKSKLAGEQLTLAAYPKALVIRTNFYGWSPEGHAPTFAEWLYKSLLQRAPIRLIKDYFFNSLEVHFLSEALERLAQIDAAAGIFNIASPERVSKYDFGIAMAKVFGLSVEGVSAGFLKDQPFAVPRPADLSLSTAKAEALLGYRLAGLYAGLERLRQTLPAPLASAVRPS